MIDVCIMKQEEFEEDVWAQKKIDQAQFFMDGHPAFWHVTQKL